MAKVASGAAKVAGGATQMLQQDESTIQLAASDDDDKTSKLSKKHGPTFIITFCSLLIAFYIAASLLAHYAYREYKGIAEDVAGGSIDYVDGNILHYAVIAKREDDRLEEEEE